MSPSNETLFFSKDTAPFHLPGSFAKGPRNVPKPDSRKRKRQVARAARKRNRGAYSGR